MCNNDNYDNTDDKDISSQNSKKSGLSSAIYLKKRFQQNEWIEFQSLERRIRIISSNRDDPFCEIGESLTSSVYR